MAKMNIVTIPRDLVKEGELVVMPKNLLDELIRLSQKAAQPIELTALQKKALITARKNKKLGKVLTFDELKSQLETAN